MAGVEPLGTQASKRKTPKSPERVGLCGILDSVGGNNYQDRFEASLRYLIR